MTANVSYPGVYVREASGGARAIAGVSTSTALFLGEAADGPIDEPVLCTSFEAFARTFGEDSSAGQLATYVRLFFMNGGSVCYVMRLASGAKPATVTLQSETNDQVLELIAKNAGTSGNFIQATVDYAGQHPESLFNLSVFQLEVDAAGNAKVTNQEKFTNLSMDPDANAYAPTLIEQRSELVTAAAPANALSPEEGTSVSGRPLGTDAASIATELETLIKDTSNQFRISVSGSRFVDVTIDPDELPDSASATEANIATAFEEAINQALSSESGAPTVTVNFIAGPNDTALNPYDPGDATPPGHAPQRLLRIENNEAKDVRVQPARQNDLAVKLMLGSGQGGIEHGAYRGFRPAPTGVSMGGEHEDLLSLASADPQTISYLEVTGIKPDGTVEQMKVPIDAADDRAAGNPIWNYSDKRGLTKFLTNVAGAINAKAQAERRSFGWQARVSGYRLMLTPTAGDANFEASVAFKKDDDSDVFATRLFETNVRSYSLGDTGSGSYQTPGDAGTPGSSPLAEQYEQAYPLIERQVDLFNLMVLPPTASESLDMAQVYGPASAFCQKQRAFLLMDPPDKWTDPQSAMEQVDEARIGVVNDHAAIFYPRVKVREGGLERTVGPAGAMAGLFARTDSSRGVWKAPAGTEAELRGVVGVKQPMSDTDNGVINPRGINAIRVFPNGIVNWGARTLDGDDDFASEWKYIPVRRLALYIEESLYRGLKWTVFEPNDEPLWSQIRLNVGSFMHRLFRQQAFAGETPDTAYHVKCDADTTTPGDQALGIVNVNVAFAPLRPAEFVVLTLRQKTAEANG